MQPEERQKKAVDMIAEGAKQLITVSAGILTFTVTFYEKLKVHNAGPSAWLLVLAWIAYLASMWCGFLTIDGVTTALANLGYDFVVYDKEITKPARGQRYLFLIGTVFILVFGTIVSVIG